MIVAGFDLSLTSTGTAHVDTETRRWGTWRVRTAPSRSVSRVRGQASRMSEIADCAEHVVETVEPDVVVLEGLSMASLGDATRDLAGLWWVVASRLLAMGVEDIVVVAPSTRAKYAAGHGRAGKAEVVAGIVAAHGMELKRSEHDVADAVALAAFGARRAGAPVEVVPQPWHGQVVADFVRRETERNV